MLYKTDWADAKPHFNAWWAGSSHGRPALAFCAPRDRALPRVPKPPTPETTRERALSVDVRLAQQENFFAERRFFGEMFPSFTLDLGPGSLALYLGCEPGFSDETIWFEPCIDPDDPESTPLPQYDPDNRWWRLHLDMIRKGAERAHGKCLMNVPDLVENIDILSAMRDPQTLLFDLYDRPSWVKTWLRRLDDLYFQYFDPIHSIVRDESGGNAFTAFNVWAPGRMAKVQCDFAFMIGSDMFAEFVLPGLARQCANLDYSVYHLDGPNCIQHVQHLVKIPHLNAIQWTPGDGSPPLEDPCWYPLYHQVREAGKSLLLLGVSEDGACRIVRELGSPDGLFFMLNREAENEAEGDEIMKRAESWA